MRVFAIVLVIVGAMVTYLALVKKQNVYDMWTTITTFFTPASKTAGGRTVQNGMTRALKSQG